MDRQAVHMSLHVNVHNASSSQENSQTHVADMLCSRVV